MSAIWQDSIQPKMRISQQETDAQKFEGNTTHPDHFKLLVQDGETVLIGSRNIVYNISLTSLQENKRLEWYSPDEDVRMCRLKGKSEQDCHNYIRVLAKKSDDLLLVCGTNSFKPRCRDYRYTASGDYDMIRESAGEGICPYDPHHNSTAVFAGEPFPFFDHLLIHRPVT
jgi:semaphorin 6